MVRIEKLKVTVTVEGNAEAGERAFARLFDKFCRLREEQSTRRSEQATTMARDRSLSPSGGRQ